MSHRLSNLATKLPWWQQHAEFELDVKYYEWCSFAFSLMFCLHNPLGYVVLIFLFACLNFNRKLRHEFITLYSFIYCSNVFLSHIKYLDYLVSYNFNILIWPIHMHALIFIQNTHPSSFPHSPSQFMAFYLKTYPHLFSHSLTSERSGFLPNAASLGVVPLTAFILVWFINQIT